MYINYKALITLSERGYYLPRLFISVYIILIIICTSKSNVTVENWIRQSPYENILAVMDIFCSNKDLLLNKTEEFNQKEIELLKYVKENIDYDSKMEIITDEDAYYWQYVLLQHLNDEDKNIKYYGQSKLLYKLITLQNKIGKVDYMVYFNKTDTFNKLKDKLFENAVIIYENEAGGILKNNN